MAFTARDIKEFAAFLANASDNQVLHIREEANVPEERALAAIEAKHRERVNALLTRYNDRVELHHNLIRGR